MASMTGAVVNSIAAYCYNVETPISSNKPLFSYSHCGFQLPRLIEQDHKRSSAYAIRFLSSVVLGNFKGIYTFECGPKKIYPLRSNSWSWESFYITF